MTWEYTECQYATVGWEAVVACLLVLHRILIPRPTGNAQHCPGDTNTLKGFKCVFLKYIRSTTGTTCFFSQTYRELNVNTGTPCICTSYKT